MKPLIKRLSFPIVLFFCFVIISESELQAQNLDTLDHAIDKILRNELKPGVSHTIYSYNDSIKILQLLSKGDEFKSINSDSSLFYIKEALNLSLQSHSLKLISLATQDLGGYYLYNERYQEAMSCYLKSLRIEEKGNDEIRIADLKSELGLLYYYMEVFDKSLNYLQKAMEVYQARQDTIGIIKTLSYIGTLQSSREYCEKRNEEEKRLDFQTAISYFEKSINYASLIGDEKWIAKGNQNIASVYNKLKKPEIALGYIQKSLDYYREINDPEGILSALYTIGKTYYRLKNYDKAIQSYQESEKLALERNLKGGIQYLYEAMAMPYYDIKDYKNAYNCYIKYMTIRDSVYNAEKSKQIIELETKYQSEVKENEILRLTSEKRQKNNLVYLLLAVIVLLGSSVYYYVRLIKKNKTIGEQNIQIRERKISELEKERQFLAARSVLEGEEAERSRLASDLHNGLGGLLSGIKINLSTMKENTVMTHENVRAFTHAISLLDTSISELRRIAHNLMPETLHHYGLKTALEDFCTQVSPIEQPVISLQFFGDEIRYTKELELTMYRIIQELINNALKHAGANRINVQVFSEPGRLYAQVTDNGKGFDITRVEKERKGKGLDNIRDRVTALNGKFELWSQPDQGTEISVEIEIS